MLNYADLKKMDCVWKVTEHSHCPICGNLLYAIYIEDELRVYVVCQKCKQIKQYVE